RSSKEHREMPSERDLKPQRSDRGDQRDVEQTYKKERQGLAENEFSWTDGGNHNLFQGADLAFPHHSEGGQGCHEHQRQAANYSRNKKPAAFQIRVVPRALLKSYVGNLVNELGRDAVDAVLLVVAGEADCDLVHVAGGDQGSIGIGGIDDDLQRRALSFAKRLSKPRIDLQRDGSVPSIDQVPNLAIIVGVAAHVEVRTGREPGDEFPAFLATVQIEHCGGDVMNLECGRVTEDEHLRNWRDEEHKARALVAEDLNEFLDEHLLQTREHMWLLTGCGKKPMSSTSGLKSVRGSSSVAPL